jgi:hypothetical protein
MASTILSIGHTLDLSFEILDQNGNVMLTPPAPDSAPAWSNTTPASETIVAASSGLTAVGTPVAPGNDIVSVNFTIGGKAFSASLAVEIDPAPQVATSAVIIATVS